MSARQRARWILRVYRPKTRSETEHKSLVEALNRAARLAMSLDLDWTLRAGELWAPFKDASEEQCSLSIMKEYVK